MMNLTTINNISIKYYNEEFEYLVKVIKLYLKQIPTVFNEYIDTI